MPHLSNQGVRIHYRDEYRDQGQKNQGPALLLTHGYGASLSMWEPQVAALRDSCRPISWDLRGHAGSDSPQEAAAYTQAASLSDMCAILDELDIERAVICGMSLGGYLSLAFHLAHPERTAGLILVSCGPGYRNAEARGKWNDFANRAARRVDERGIAALGEGAEIPRDEHRDPRGLSMAAKGILTQADDSVISSLPDIQVPTLVLVGSEDKIYHSGSTYMAEKIPGATQVMLENAGHACNLDQPEACNEQMLNFLNGLPRD